MTRQVLLALLNRFPMHPIAAPTYDKTKITEKDTPILEKHATINFEVNSAQISLDSKAAVDDIGGFMKAYENTAVEIVGNTDTSGDRNHNIVLSKQRADAVKEYLMQKYGFPASRILTRGAGPDHPVADNATPEGREKNRRSDIKAFPNKG
jgi:OOP family OmpA-OmpF porin